jgi:prepilin-type processing-associated H-X9-DG protein
MRNGKWTLSDLIVGLVLGLMMLALLGLSLPRMVADSRQAGCSDNLKQIGLAIHNYHSAYNHFPMGSGGSSSGSEAEPMLGNADRLSPFVALTPFMEEQALWEQIANPLQHNGEMIPAMGPAPWVSMQQYPPWGKRPAVLVCADDSAGAQFPLPSSYVVCYGDAILDIGNSPDQAHLGGRATRRGVFARQTRIGFRDILDGTANTLMISEIKIGGVKVAKDIRGLIADPSQCIAAHQDAGTQYWPEGRTACWADGLLLSTGFQTILPPNAPSCTSEKGPHEGILSVSSHHRGGAHVLFVDGRVMFAPDSIDAGDASSPTVADGTDKYQASPRPGSPSPYGIWGALGTRASAEVIKEDPLLPPRKSFTKEMLKSVAALPLEDWTAASGKGSIRARQLELRQDGIVVLLTESGDVREIGLSKLTSEHAYRAVIHVRELRSEAVKALRRDLDQALVYLEQRKFEEFMEECVLLPPHLAADVNARSAIMSELIQNRGKFIEMLDAVLIELQSPNDLLVAKLGEGEAVLTGGRGPRLQVKLFDGKWRIAN